MVTRSGTTIGAVAVLAGGEAKDKGAPRRSMGVSCFQPHILQLLCRCLGGTEFWLPRAFLFMRVTLV